MKLNTKALKIINAFLEGHPNCHAPEGIEITEQIHNKEKQIIVRCFKCEAATQVA